MNQATLQRRPAAPLIDLSQFNFNEMARQAIQPWSDAFETWRTGMADMAEQAQMRGSGRGQREGRHGRHHDQHRHDRHHQDCHCQSCEADRCGCRCCITDADLVLETRVAERRIVTVIIENHWRRERDIELELSSFTNTVQGVEVKAEILTTTAFKLAPCGEAQVVIGVTVTPPKGEGQTDTPADAAAAAAANNPNGAVRVENGRRDIPDLEACAVSYADLRVKGCDLRSIRIAVAVLPRDCDAYVADCACGCC